MEQHRVWWREVRYYPTDVVIEGETYSEVCNKFRDIDCCEVEVDFDHPDTQDGEFILD